MARTFPARVSALLVSLVLLLWTTGTRVQAEHPYYGIDYNAKAAYFTFQYGGVDLYVFALNVADNGDIYFHMSGPVAHCWIGVGFGESMDNAFMLIAYPSADGLKTTISPRISSGHYEPVYDPTKQIVHIHNDTYAPNANTVTDNGTGTIIAHSVCLNCSRWATGFLDTENPNQPFIFAVGPNITFRSDSPEASIPRHGLAGQFTMDMRHATNYSGWYGRVPAPNVPHFIFPPNDTAFASSNSAPAFNVIEMSNTLPGVHAILMCISFVLIFPAGALVMGFLRRTLAHAAVQLLGFVLVFAGFGIAVKFSGQYNKSKHYDSAHQVIGFIVLAGLVVQLGLGLVHHSFYLRSQQPTPFGRIHMFLGPLVMVLGIINGGIGIDFANNHALKVPYAVVVGVLAALFIIAFSCFLCLKRKKKYKPEKTDTTPTQYPSPFAGDQESEFEMRDPTYGASVPEPYEPTMPYSPGMPASPRSPWSGSVPYTPVSAYTPVTPSAWKKDELARWGPTPYREFG